LLVQAEPIDDIVSSANVIAETKLIDEHLWGIEHIVLDFENVLPRQLFQFAEVLSIYNVDN